MYYVHSKFSENEVESEELDTLSCQVYTHVY